MRIKFKDFTGAIESFMRNNATVARQWLFQDRDGTIADDTDLALKVNVSDLVDISTAPIVGDVTGTLGASVVEKIQGVQVHTTAPTNGQVLQYISANSRYEPTTITPTVVQWTSGISPSSFASTTTLEAWYIDNGVMVEMYWDIRGTGTSATTLTLQLPFAPYAAMTGFIGHCFNINGATAFSGGISMAGGSTTATIFVNAENLATTWTGSAARRTGGIVRYRKV